LKNPPLLRHQPKSHLYPNSELGKEEVEVVVLLPQSKVAAKSWHKLFCCLVGTVTNTNEPIRKTLNFCKQSAFFHPLPIFGNARASYAHKSKMTISVASSLDINTISLVMSREIRSDVFCVTLPGSCYCQKIPVDCADAVFNHSGVTNLFEAFGHYCTLLLQRREFDFEGVVYCLYGLPYNGIKRWHGDATKNTYIRIGGTWKVPDCSVEVYFRNNPPPPLIRHVVVDVN
jgi:hypothetical protein